MSLNKIKLLANPFTVGKPILPEHFSGYVDQVMCFYEYLLGESLQPLRILGLRRSGKTSFLRYLESGLALRLFELPPSSRELTLIYIDLTRISQPSEFYQTIVQEVTKKISPAAPLKTNPNSRKVKTSQPRGSSVKDARSFDLWIDDVLSIRPSLSLVILLDEFEKLIVEDSFNTYLFGHLRTMASSSNYSQRFTWVTSSSEDIHSLLAKKSRSSDPSEVSPFWNIFHPSPIILGGLSDQETEQAIQRTAATQDVEFTPEECAAIYAISGKIPYFIQATASAWFEARQKKQVANLIPSAVLERLLKLEQIQHIFHGYWKRQSEAQQKFLLDLAECISPAPISEQAICQLVDYGLIREKNTSAVYVGKATSWEIAGELFCQYLLQYRPQVGDCYAEFEVDAERPGDRDRTIISFSEMASKEYGEDENELAYQALEERIRQLEDKTKREEAKKALTGIKDEIKKGDQANSTKLQKWGKFLAEIAPDFFDVAIDTIANPILGIKTALKKIAERSKQEK